MEKVYGLHCDISSVSTNIYNLYRQLKKDDGYSDVTEVLKDSFRSQLDSLEGLGFNKERQIEINRIKEELSLLDRPFASIYLVFDSDLQHRSDDTTDKMTIVNNNIAELNDMLEFFSNETEQGKLYVNYPMMESYRDCEDYFDKNYRDRLVSLDVLFGETQAKGYKATVESTKLARVHIRKITEEQFNRLTCMNVFKLNWMTNHVWEKPSYDDFLVQSQQDAILALEAQSCRNLQVVSVLNTLLFFIVDYKGRDFYDCDILPGLRES